MEIRAARDNILVITQGILLGVVRSTDDVLRTVEMPIVLRPGIKRKIIFNSAATQKCIKIIIEKSGSFLDFGAFSVQLALFVLSLLFFWCPCMAINVRVQYNGGLLPDIILLLTQWYHHRGTRLNAMKRFCICSL